MRVLEMDMDVGLFSVLIGFLGFIVYWDSVGLHGDFVYDDAGSVTGNQAVVGNLSWFDVWKVDFWGIPIGEDKSHKSYRPLTTLSFKLNFYMHGMEDTFWYHVVNVVLHAIVCMLVSLVCGFVFVKDREKVSMGMIIASVAFALHPIHTEAVCNITSRGELLMSTFYLLGFLTYAKGLSFLSKSPRGKSFFPNFFLCSSCIIFTALAMLAKEQGIVLGLTCVVYDFCYTDVSFSHVFTFFGFGPKVDPENKRAKAKLQNVKLFLTRSFVLGFLTLCIGFFRLYLNGNANPNIIPDQNPAAFAEETFTRIASMNYVYVLYFWSLIYPKDLSCDWSGESIQLIREPTDPRVVSVVVLWIWFLGSIIFALNSSGRIYKNIILQSLVGFMFVPFLLSSNLIIKIGAMKAERLLYLPSVGYCLYLGFCVQLTSQKLLDFKRLGKLLIHLSIGLLFSLYALKVLERSYDWSNSLRLWQSAYNINPISTHTRYNLALELTKAGENEQAQELLKKLLEENKFDFPTRYIYAFTFKQMDQCDKTNTIANTGLKLLEKKVAKTLRDDIPHDKSLMLTLKSYCAKTVGDMSKFAQEAIEIAPHNSQAIARVNDLVQLAKKLEESGMIRQNPH